jgi:hypothetical protein
MSALTPAMGLFGTADKYPTSHTVVACGGFLRGTRSGCESLRKPPSRESSTLTHQPPKGEVHAQGRWYQGPLARRRARMMLRAAFIGQRRSAPDRGFG